MGRIGIQYLEQRFDLVSEIAKLENSIMKRRISIVGSLSNIIDTYIMEFPLNITSRNIDEYLSDRNIEKNDDNLAEYFLFRMNFYFIFFTWYYNTGKISKNISQVSEEIEYVLELAFRSMNFILKGLNYKAENLDVSESRVEFVSFIKRDVDIDSILPFIETDIRIDVLSYLDFRLENNLIEKEAIIGRLYKDLETKKLDLNVDPFKALYSTTKQALNFARHAREVEYTLDEKIEICNKAFYLYIHLIRSPQIKHFTEDLKKYFIRKKNEDNC